jgi:transcriptional regulator with XRE-family HTH domain
MTQQRAAKKLGVSQAYLALMEGGKRRVTDELGSKMMNLYRLPVTALPLDTGDVETWDSASITKSVGGLGYPGFRHVRAARRRNPAVILLAALSRDELEVRVIESLPWLVVEYHDLDWEWLTREAKLNDVQNRLGFVVALGRRLAEKQNREAARSRLIEVNEVLDRARLAREDTLCQQSLSDAERRWLREKRPSDARHWNLLTDLDLGHLPYAA